MISLFRNFRPLLSGLAIAISVVVFSGIPAQAYEMWGRWSGVYGYNDRRPPVNFTFEVTQPGVHFAGRMTEPNTFGNSRARFLYADFEGQVNPDGSVYFIKFYDGSGNVGHGVEYHGRFGNRGNALKGSWRIGNAHGWFTLNRE